MESDSLHNISDTARWVAVYRAMETGRRDAIFRDPFAKTLVGDRGEAIVRSMKVGGTAWAMIVRTAVMDEIIPRSTSGTASTVINLAAGLDARPDRLPLRRRCGGSTWTCRTSFPTKPAARRRDAALPLRTGRGGPHRHGGAARAVYPRGAEQKASSSSPRGCSSTSRRAGRRSRGRPPRAAGYASVADRTSRRRP